MHPGRAQRADIETDLDAPLSDEMAQMAAHAGEATAFLKALAHDGRLMILCLLVERERTVTELERLLGARQAAVSQQLARLRMEGLVENRREGKNLIYSLADGRVRVMVQTLHDLFCADRDAAPRG
ncbi:ArsR/SmtB family transcription factor [Oceanicella actignis]|uniref:DNA-binding transcriptional regulator, ArsR family n=1 Tax=Oceanicella actignis TaxID=1189325 RepID=A0A1M7TJW4_9RHOB|nr:metalloregulator ArsR/SmtB family transcription factor [Oceanicella actignis]SET67211.1 transcriptional regulator, ArsR family [Oceanicella actignis]SHN70986.1 DNA-binding transcriptional regulator, ArsR family [Oceanicella actignis]